VTKIVKKLLDSLGYNAIPVNNSVEALQLYRENVENINLLITDLTMPEMTGLTLALKVHEINAALPIIMMSGYGNKVSLEAQHRAGISEIITKPIMVSEMAKLINKILIKKG
jgi:DNA-binding NtrC family response regulator